VVHGVWKHEGYLIPDLASLSSERLELLGELMEWLAERLGRLLRSLQDLLGHDGCRRDSKEQRSCGDLHVAA